MRGNAYKLLSNVIKNGGKLEFGTEIVAAKDGTLAALLGASPGASVSVKAMIDVLERCFTSKLNTQDWQQKLKQLVPSYGESLIENADLLKTVRKSTQQTLKLLQGG